MPSRLRSPSFSASSRSAAACKYPSASVSVRWSLPSVRTRVVLEAADKHIRQLHVIDLDTLILDGPSPRKLYRRLEVQPVRHVAKQRGQSGQRMDVYRQRRELGFAGARSSTRRRRCVAYPKVETVDRELALETLDGRVAFDVANLDEVVQRARRRNRHRRRRRIGQRGTGGNVARHNVA